MNPNLRTGKTTCLAEAIGQYHKQFPEKRILVIAPSHAAADNICLALGKYFRKSGQLYRMARVSKITDEKVLDYMPKLTSAESQNINNKVKRILDNSKSLVFSEEEYAIQEWIIFLKSKRNNKIQGVSQSYCWGVPIIPATSKFGVPIRL